MAAALVHVDDTFAKFDVMPIANKTVALRHKAFIAIGRAGCRAHALRLRHSIPPFILLRLIENPEEVGIVSALCEGMHDEYASGFVTRHKDDLTGDDAVAELVGLVALGKLTTVPLENANATLKHLSDVLSTHVTTPPAEVLSSTILLKRVRQSVKSRRPPTTERKTRKDKRPRKNKNANAKTPATASQG